MTQIIVRNQKLARKIEVNAIAAAVILLGKYDARIVSQVIWNRYGFLNDVIGISLKIHGIGTIEFTN